MSWNKNRVWYYSILMLNSSLLKILHLWKITVGISKEGKISSSTVVNNKMSALFFFRERDFMNCIVIPGIPYSFSILMINLNFYYSLETK